MLAIKFFICYIMHEVRVEIDTRERVGSDPTAFAKVLNSVRKQLPFGDAMFYVDGKLAMVVERKTTTDFVSSILSSHMNDQLRALLTFKKENPAVPVVIIIEGDLSQADLRGVSPERFVSVIKEWTWLGITRYDTMNAKDSVDYYNATVTKFELMGSVADYQQLTIDTIPIMSAGKKSQVTANNFLSVTLGNISGISASVAECLAKQYTSLEQFVQTYDPDKAQLQMVGKKRLGPKRAHRIQAFLKNRVVEGRIPKKPKK